MNAPVLIIAETNFGVSAQVLQEFLVNVTRKADSALSIPDTLEWIDRLTDRPCVAIDREPVIAAARVAERYQIHYWDSAIIVAAMRLGATILYTEYLNHGQTYGSVKAVNPFVPN